MSWEALLTAFGGTAILVTAIGWLARSIIIHLLSKDVENYKTQLRFNADAQVLRFKADIEKGAYEHQIRFGKLHEERAIVIKDLYRFIARFHSDAIDFVCPFQGAGEPKPEDKLKALSASASEVQSYFNENRIFFAKEMCAQINAFCQQVKVVVDKLALHYRFPEDRRNMKEMIQDWWEAWEELDKDIVKLRETLEEDFRQLLGVNSVLIKSSVDT